MNAFDNAAVNYDWICSVPVVGVFCISISVVGISRRFIFRNGCGCLSVSQSGCRIQSIKTVVSCIIGQSDIFAVYNRRRIVKISDRPVKFFVSVADIYCCGRVDYIRWSDISRVDCYRVIDVFVSTGIRISGRNYCRKSFSVGRSECIAVDCQWSFSGFVNRDIVNRQAVQFLAVNRIMIRPIGICPGNGVVFIIITAAVNIYRQTFRSFDTVQKVAGSYRNVINRLV